MRLGQIIQEESLNEEKNLAPGLESLQYQRLHKGRGSQDKTEEVHEDEVMKVKRRERFNERAIFDKCC